VKFRFLLFSERSQHFIYADPESNIMGKRKTKEQQDKETLAEVVKEMAKPRVAMSARECSPTFRNTLLVVKDNVEE
jgi:site-specific DNA-adenine methylase